MLAPVYAPPELEALEESCVDYVCEQLNIDASTRVVGIVHRTLAFIKGGRVRGHAFDPAVRSVGSPFIRAVFGTIAKYLEETYPGDAPVPGFADRVTLLYRRADAK